MRMIEKSKAAYCENYFFILFPPVYKETDKTVCRLPLVPVSVSQARDLTASCFMLLHETRWIWGGGGAVAQFPVEASEI
jgi:hypothetical protein